MGTWQRYCPHVSGAKLEGRTVEKEDFPNLATASGIDRPDVATEVEISELGAMTDVMLLPYGSANASSFERRCALEELEFLGKLANQYQRLGGQMEVVSTYWWTVAFPISAERRLECLLCQLSMQTEEK